MLSENLIALRNIHNYSQEEVAEKIGISRQAYAKWESGATVPDVSKCKELADFYETSVDELLKDPEKIEGTDQRIFPGPKGKHIFGTATINEKGQIVIPKKARDIFNINAGDNLVILGDEETGGIAILKAELFESQMMKAIRMAGIKN